MSRRATWIPGPARRSWTSCGSSTQTGDYRRPRDPRSGHRRPRQAPGASGGRAGGGRRPAAAPRGGVESVMMTGPMLSEARQAMGANRLRTFLTMLGMMIGVGAVIMMLAVGQGARDFVNRSIASMGRNLFVVLAGSATASGVRLGTGNVPTLTVADAEALEELSAVDAVAPILPGAAQIVHGANNWGTSVLGTT